MICVPSWAVTGEKIVHSPNMDRLAKEGVRFNRAYCQEAICGPSRASLMTGMRPDNNRIVENNTYFRDTVPDVTTLPTHFANHGYNTVGIGKVYHNRQNDEASWNCQPTSPPRPEPMPMMGYQLPEIREYLKRKRKEVIAQSLGAEPGNQNQGQCLPQSTHGPSCIWKESMIGVVSMLAHRIGKRQDACDGSAGGT